MITWSNNYDPVAVGHRATNVTGVGRTVAGVHAPCVVALHGAFFIFSKEDISDQSEPSWLGTFGHQS